MASLSVWRTSTNVVRFSASGLTKQSTYKFWIYSGGEWWVKKQFNAKSSTDGYDVSISDNNSHSTCLTSASVTDPDTQPRLDTKTVQPYNPKTYTISYNNGGHGSAPSSQTKIEDITLTLRPFIGDNETSNTTTWTLTPNSGGISGLSVGGSGVSQRIGTWRFSQKYWASDQGGQYLSQGLYSRNQGTTMTAVWDSTWAEKHSCSTATCWSYKADSTTNKDQITLDANGGSNSIIKRTKQIISYERLYWYFYDTSGYKHAISATTVIEKNTIIYPEISAKTTWDRTITLPTVNEMTRVGYSLVGFSSTRIGAVEYQPGQKITLEGAIKTITLYAVWTKKTYTLSFDLNGGSGSTPASQTFSVDNRTYNLPTVLYDNYTKTGYTAKGWGYSTTTTSTIPNGSTIPDAYMKNHTLYIVWEANNYVVTTDAGNGTIGTTSQHTLSYNKKYDQPYGWMNELPTARYYNGDTKLYQFRGWWAEPPSQTQSTMITDYTILKTPRNHSIYAKWTTYEITYDVGEGSGSPRQYVYYSGGSGHGINYFHTKSFEDFPNWSAPQGKQFYKWDTSPSGKGTTYTKNRDYYNLTDDLHLYAIYSDSSLHIPVFTYTVNSASCTSTQLSINVKVDTDSLESGYWNCQLLDSNRSVVKPAISSQEHSYNAGGPFTYVFTGLSPNTKYLLQVANYGTSGSYSAAMSDVSQQYFRTRQSTWQWTNGEVQPNMDFSIIKYSDGSSSWLNFVQYLKNLGYTGTVAPAVNKIFTAKMMNDVVFGLLKAEVFDGNRTKKNQFKSGEQVFARYFNQLATKANNDNNNRDIIVN